MRSLPGCAFRLNRTNPLRRLVMHRLLPRILTVSVLLLVLAACASAEPPRSRSTSASPQDTPASKVANDADRPVIATSREEQVDALMVEYDRNDAPGAVVGVIRDGEVIFAKGYGMANLTHGVPITPETRFNIGSVSKQFTGFALALLESRGALSLEDPVGKHLPQVPEFEHEVTLRHLLTHTSGYRQAYDISFLAGRMPVESEDVFRRAEALEVVRRQPKLEFPPGSRYQYNSTAYVLLALVVERVTGEPFPEWMQENVFDPLGMKNTVIESEIEQVIPGAADSYTATDHGGYRRLVGNRAVYGAGEIYTTVDDLVGWLRNFRTAELGGAGVQERMRERFVLTSGDTIDYALGILVDEHRGLQRLHHGGSHAGYRAYLSYYPELDAGIVVMSNDYDFRRQNVVEEMDQIFLGQYMEPEQAAEVTEQDTTFPHSETWSPTAMELSAYTGRYFSAEAGTVYTFRPANGQLVAEHRWSSGRLTRGEGDLLFAPLKKDAFVGENTPMEIRFERAEDGSIIGYHASLIGGASGVWFARVQSPH